MVNPCFADRYLEYLQAAQMARMGLTMALGKLRDVPDVGVRANATAFTSPASTRLKAEVTSIGASISDAETRIAELITFLKTVEAKYEHLYVAAEAARKALEK